MSESAERIAAGDALAGTECGWCGEALTAEDHVARCTECAKPHHEGCWDAELGCSDQDCLNAPLPRLDRKDRGRRGPTVEVVSRNEALHALVEARGPQPARAASAGGRSPDAAASAGGRGPDAARSGGRGYGKALLPEGKTCVDCGAWLPEYEEICGSCKAINTPDGLYHGPKVMAPGAYYPLLIAVAGLFFCGPLLGPVAIARASAIKATIRRDPRLTGEGLATAATVIGVIDIVAWIYLLLSKAR